MRIERAVHFVESKGWNDLVVPKTNNELVTIEEDRGPVWEKQDDGDKIEMKQGKKRLELNTVGNERRETEQEKEVEKGENENMTIRTINPSVEDIKSTPKDSENHYEGGDYEREYRIEQTRRKNSSVS